MKKGVSNEKDYQSNQRQSSDKEEERHNHYQDYQKSAETEARG
jgi:hypothetical protein